MDQAEAKKLLQELVKREDLKNKICNDCSNPNPQWASISFAVFLCLQCAGTHRGFGVHISFVRSISMDTWQEDQLKRMQIGGNAAFREFMRSYTPAEQGGYNDSLSAHDTYHCWAAAQYREKLDAAIADRPWSPSAPPPTFSPPSERPSSAQGLRKSRASTRQMSSSLRNDSASPSRLSRTGTPELSQKATNEAYFANLGQANASRPADLPPSQGGRYQGFGSTPTPPMGSDNPSWGMSSANAPTLGDFQENPVGALSKGWSLFSSAVMGATKVVNENVIQPSVEKVTDPNFQASVKGYLSDAQRKAAEVGSQANEWSRTQFGVDVAGSVGGVVDGVKERIAGPERRGYGSLSTVSPTYGGEWDDQGSSALYDGGDGYGHAGLGSYGTMGPDHADSPEAETTKAATKKSTDNWDDEWKDF